MFYILNSYVFICLFNNCKFQGMFTFFMKMSANLEKPTVTEYISTIYEIEICQNVVRSSCPCLNKSRELVILSTFYFLIVMVNNELSTLETL